MTAGDVKQAQSEPARRTAPPEAENQPPAVCPLYINAAVLKPTKMAPSDTGLLSGRLDGGRGQNFLLEIPPGGGKLKVTVRVIDTPVMCEERTFGC